MPHASAIIMAAGSSIQTMMPVPISQPPRRCQSSRPSSNCRPLSIILAML